MSDKSFWKLATDMALNIGTLGATGKVEAVRQSAEKAGVRYRTSLHCVQTLEARMKSLADSRGNANRAGHSMLGEAIAVLRAFGNAKGFDVRESSDQRYQAVEKMQKTIVDFYVALEFAAGSGAGLATSASAWAAVSILGVASTGTAIGSLSGAAASKAALAWFGGGSLATSGGGMALGSVVMGGIVILPLIGVSAWLAHRAADKKIKEIEPMIKERNEETDRLNRLAKTIEAECCRVQSVVFQTQKHTTKLKETLQVLRDNIQYLQGTGIDLVDAMSTPGFDFLGTQSAAK